MKPQAHVHGRRVQGRMHANAEGQEDTQQCQSWCSHFSWKH